MLFSSTVTVSFLSLLTLTSILPLYTHIYISGFRSQSLLCVLNLRKIQLGFAFIGVIWKGDTLIDGVSQTLDMLRSKAHSLFFFLQFFFFLFLSQNFEFLIGFYFLFLYFFQGKKLVFVTNNSTKSRRQYAKKFQSLGISVSEVCFISNTFFSPKCTDFVIDLKLFFFLLQYL